VKKLVIFILVTLVSCSKSRNEYDPSKYLDEGQQKDALSGIVTYIFSAPAYTAMEDRFKPEHKNYYDSMSQRLFSLDRFYVSDNKRRYYLVIRPGNQQDQKRAAGGYYDVSADKQINHFRETFVTPQLPDSVARARGRFLFDQMVKGSLEPYLKMATYVQWPNRVSYYDSTTYEWKLDVSKVAQDTLAGDTTKVN